MTYQTDKPKPTGDRPLPPDAEITEAMSEAGRGVLDEVLMRGPEWVNSWEAVEMIYRAMRHAAPATPLEPSLQPERCE